MIGRTVQPLPAPRREHHLTLVATPNTPHATTPPVMFDQDDPAHPAGDGVFLTFTEARLIAAVVRHAAGHCPSPKACTDALVLLGEEVEQ